MRALRSDRLPRPLVLGAIVLAIACGRGEAPGLPRRTLLISIDTLRADHLGAYGHPRPTSPVLDALAAEGVLFEDVTATSPWTLPSHASLLTGLYPSRLRVLSEVDRLPERFDTLASRLTRRGFATAAVVNSVFLGRRHGLHRGFERFVYDASVEETVDRREPTRAVTRRALEWLLEPSERPLFVFAHYYDVHSDYRSRETWEARFVGPYDGPFDGSTAQLVEVERGEREIGAADAAHLADLYDAGIRQMDAELGRLFEALREAGRLESTLVVVTSDHGEEFLEHGRVMHGGQHFDEVVRVPWILRGPGIPAGRRISEPVSLVDVAPTLLGLLGQPAPEGLDGVDLSAAVRGEGRAPSQRVLFAEADNKNRAYDVKRAVRSGRFKLHYDRASGARALYDLEADPGERVDVFDANAPEGRRLLAALLDWMQASRPVHAPEAVLSPEDEQKLRSLGYLE